MLETVDMAKATECSAKITETETCKALEAMTKCSPKCMVTDAGQKVVDTAWKDAGCSGSAPKVGSAAGIRASAFTVFVSAAVALVASR